MRPTPPVDRYQRRLDLELTYIDEIDGAAKWLIEVAKICRQIEDIPHIIRGSAGSSLTTYLLGISDIDPIRWDIDVERFLNPLRDDLPDVDLDFPYHLREEVYRRVEEMYPGRVARLSTHIRFRNKSALREAVKRLGYRKRLPRKYDLSEILPGEEGTALELAAELKDTVRGVAKHVGGIVIFDGDIPKKLRIKNKDKQIRLDKHEVEEARHFKLDILSSRALAQFVEVTDKPLSQYPEEHTGVAELFSGARSLGITQTESPAFRKLCRAIRPKTLNELIMCFALIRPAAAWVSHRAMFYDEWHKTREQGDYLVFEDDCNVAIATLAQVPLSQADAIRRWFAKADHKRMEAFSNAVRERQGAKDVLDDLRCYNGFSFCKSHAVSYGRLAWALGQLKVDKPMEFWHATLNHAMSMYRYWVHVQEAKMAGWEILEGKRPWKASGDTLYSEGAYHPLVADKPSSELKRVGFWTPPDFFPDCGDTFHENHIHFRGLIATGRIYKHPRSEKAMTFITLGTGNGTYRDLVIEGAVDTKDFHVIEGHGEVEVSYGSPWVDVTAYKMESL